MTAAEYKTKYKDLKVGEFIWDSHSQGVHSFRRMTPQKNGVYEIIKCSQNAINTKVYVDQIKKHLTLTPYQILILKKRYRYTRSEANKNRLKFKRKTVSLDERMKIIDMHQNQNNETYIAQHLGLTRTQVKKVIDPETYIESIFIKQK